MSGVDNFLLYEFVEEARDHLSSLEDDFMIVEKNLDDPDHEVINKIFRAIHTIKGSCGFLDLTAMAKLTHSMESLLSILRDGEMKPTSDMLDSLLGGVDILNVMLDDIDNSNEVSIEFVENRVASFIPGASPAIKADEKKKIETEEPLSIEDHEQELLSKCSPGEFLYELKYNLSQWEKESSKSPVFLVEELQKLGDVIEGELHVSQDNIREKIPEGDTYYLLYYRSVLDQGLISGVSKPAPSEIRIIASLEPVHDEIEDIKDSTDEGSTQDLTNTSRKKETQSRRKETDTLRVRVDILNDLMMLAGELVLVRNQQLLHQDRSDTSSRGITQRLDIVTTELQEMIMKTRMQPIGNVFGRFPRVVRDLARKMGKMIEVETIGAEVELDKNILEALVDPLTHMIRNSCDHGIEIPDERTAAGKTPQGTIILKAYHEGGQINIEISDDGKGLSKDKIKAKTLENGLKTEEELSALSDSELYSLIFLPGFSTAGEVSDLSGRGVGMDVVKTAIEQLGGVIELESEQGFGTTFKMKLPLTLAIIPSLIVKVGTERFAIPQINLEELVCLYDNDVIEKIESVGFREVYRLRDQLLPMVRLSELLDRNEPFTVDVQGEITERYNSIRNRQRQELEEARTRREEFHLSLNFAVLKFGTSRFGLILDSIIGTEEIVVKPMHRAVKDLPIYSGATVLGDGGIALILDTLGVARHAAVDYEMDQSTSELNIVDGVEDVENRESLLLFTNGGKEHFAVNLDLVKRVEKLDMTKLEHIGYREFATVNGVSTRIIRLENSLELSHGTEREEMFLILPKKAKHPFGILTTQLVDIGEYAINLENDSYTASGVLGSALLNDRMTLLLEPEMIASATESEWYLAE